MNLCFIILLTVLIPWGIITFVTGNKENGGRVFGTFILVLALACIFIFDPMLTRMGQNTESYASTTTINQ